MNDATRAFIHSHRTDNVHRLALEGRCYTDVDIALALRQIEGWQRTREKLPSWASNEDILYPQLLALEQCSSDFTSQYKARVARRAMDGCKGQLLVDMTGGMGVDHAALAPLFEKTIYIERQEDLCTLARHNFEALKLHHTEVVCDESIQQMEELTKNGVLPTMIYADPARRSDKGQRTYSIPDCMPNVLPHLKRWLECARWVMLKLSPMLDWHEAVRQVQEAAGQCVREVHIVATRGECKELLLLLNTTGIGPYTVTCANDEEEETFVNTPQGQSTTVEKHTTLPETTGTPPHPMFLYEPHAALMKGGFFTELASRYHVTPLATNTHLYLSSEPQPTFPGRQFRVIMILPVNQRAWQENMPGVTQANITTRNFPMPVAQLRKKLHLHEGGEHYVFAVRTTSHQYLLVVCKKHIPSD